LTWPPTLEKELDADMADPYGGKRPTADILAMDKVVEEFFLGDEFGGLSKYSTSMRMAREQACLIRSQRLFTCMDFSNFTCQSVLNQ
jgi:hypothetical protein